MAVGSEPKARERRGLFELISDLPNLVVALVRGEIDQFKAELAKKAKSAGIGAALFAAAAVVAFFALGVLIAAAILGIATALPGWLSALIIGVVLLLVAGVLVLIGVKRLQRGVPPVPKAAIESVKEDVQAFKGVGNYDR